MQAHDYVSAGLSLVALIVSIVSLVRSGRHNEIVRQYASAGPETAILGQISQARNRVADITVKLLEIVKGRLPDNLTADEKRASASMTMVFHETVENLLNTYELACGMYLDKKIERERFKRQYSEEIKKLVESDVEAYSSRLLPITSPYRAMKKVYEEWHNLEK